MLLLLLPLAYLVIRSVIFNEDTMYPFILFIVFLFIYHTSEPLITWIYNREDFSRDSFLFSLPYCAAMSLAVAEYFIESYFFPDFKPRFWSISVLGFFLCLIGDSMRKAAMLTGKASFTHQIKYYKRQEHKLITHGIYRYVRHPGYLGWFIWSVGTQILLCNPVCSVIFFAWSAYFFYDRIPYEEKYLIRFFGDEYVRYRDRTPTYLPFVK